MPCLIDHQVPIHLEVLSLALRMPLYLLPPQHSAHAKHQLPNREVGLDHVVIRAHLKADHPIDLVAAGGEVRASVLCPGFVDTKIFEAERNRPDVLRVGENQEGGSSDAR